MKEPPGVLEPVTSSAIACCSQLHTHDHRHWVLPGCKPVHPAQLVWAGLLLPEAEFAPGGLEMGQNNSLIKLAPRPKMFREFYLPSHILGCYNCPIYPVRDSAVKSNKNAQRNSVNKMSTMWRCPTFEYKSSHCNSLRNFKIQTLISLQVQSPKEE